MSNETMITHKEPIIPSEVANHSAIVDTHCDWIWEIDLSGIYHFSSEASQALLGIAPHEILGKSIFDFLANDELIRLKVYFSEIFSQGLSFNGLLTRKINASNQEIILESSGEPLFDNHGNIYGYRGIERQLSNATPFLGKQLFQQQYSYATAPIGLCFINFEHCFVTANAMLIELFGLGNHALSGQQVAAHLPELVPLLEEMQQPNYPQDKILNSEFSRATAEKYFQVHIQLAGQQDQPYAGFSVAIIETTHFKHIEKSLRDNQLHYRNMVELNPQIQWTADTQGNLTDISSHLELVSGKHRSDILYKKWSDSIHYEDRDFAVQAWEKARTTGQIMEIEVRFCHVLRGWNWMRLRAAPSYDASGNIERWYGTAEDIHERKLLELKLLKANRRLEIQARTDALTKLPNRREFKKLLHHEFMRSRRYLTHLSILMIDIDYFKNFNDHYGHLSGDACLRLVARTLRKSLKRNTDVITRFGGEEFAAILPDTDQQGAWIVAEQIKSELESIAIKHNYSEFKYITLSQGIATYHPNIDKHVDDPVDIVRAADEALYLSKNNGRNQINTLPIAR
jgi:diguanylate cyclase (GGDEF)-like protein/PAS domain S-box-containing protein